MQKEAKKLTTIIIVITIIAILILIIGYLLYTYYSYNEGRDIEEVNETNKTQPPFDETPTVTTNQTTTNTTNTSTTTTTGGGSNNGGGGGTTTPTCTDTCNSLGYECDNWTICGNEVNCGECGDTEVCNNGKCSAAGGPYCGDTNCTGTENCTNCPQDCGCAPGEVCNEGICELIECNITNNCFYVSVTGAGTHEGSLGNEMNLSDAQNYTNANPAVQITFLLESGNYGQFYFSNVLGRSEWATYKGLKEINKPVFTNLYVKNSPNAYLRFDNIEFKTTYEFEKDNAIQIYGSANYNTSKIEIINSYINAEPNNDGNRSGKGIDLLTAKDISIKNCEIEKSSYGIRIFVAENITVTNSNIHDCHADALRIDDTHYSLFENNKIHNVRRTKQSGTTHRDAIQIIAWNPNSTSNVILRKNQVYDTESQGIHAYSKASYLGSITLENNLFYGRFADEDYADSYTIFQFQGVNALKLINNTFIPEYGSASGIWSNCTDAEIINNLFIGNMSGTSLFKVSNDMNRGYQNKNIFSDYFMSSWNINDREAVGDGIANNIELNYDGRDFFADCSNKNYYPLVNSPACNGTINEAGIAVGALPCVCTQDSQCIEVYGSGHTCDGNGECVRGVVEDIYYLDAQNGDDNWDGNSTHPWKTIDRARMHYGSPSVEAGDTVIIKEGNYGEWIWSAVDFFGGNSGDLITYKADSGANVIFEDLNWANGYAVNTKLEGLRFVCAGYGENQYDSGEYTLVFSNIQNLEVGNLYVQGCGDSEWYGSGIKITGGKSENVTIKNTEIYDIQTGLGFSFVNNLIVDNVTIHNSFNDLMSGANLRNSVIKNSHLYDAGPKYEFRLEDKDNTINGIFQEGELVVQDVTGANGTIIKANDREGYFILYLDVTNYDYENDEGYYSFSHRKLTPLTFTGTGLNDFSHNNKVWRLDRKWRVEIDSNNGFVDTFKFRYSTDGGNVWTTIEELIPITGSLQELWPSSTQWELQGTFASTTGHEVGDYWEFETGDFYPVRGQTSSASITPSYEGQAGHSDAIQIYTYPYNYDWSDNVTIKNNIITKEEGQGVFLKQMKDVVIENNILYGGFTSHPLAVQTSSLNATIKNNTICLDKPVSDLSFSDNWDFWIPNQLYRSTTIVRINSSSSDLYKLIKNHTSSESNKPESGANWQDYWEQINPDDMVFEVENNLLCGRFAINHGFGKTLIAKNNFIGVYFYGGSSHYPEFFGETYPVLDSTNQIKGNFLTEQEREDLFEDYQNKKLNPLINSPACNGSINPMGVAVGALPCVCTQDSQCEEIYGTGSTCNLQTRKCEGGLGSSSVQKSSILLIVWNCIKNLING